MSEWIKVSDRLPEHRQHVIVACKNQFGCDVFDDHYFNNRTGHFVKYGDTKTSGVTHWQPLPRPPE